jgi:hypothetical protein
MRAHYDFAKLKARKNPYLKLLKKSITIRLDRGTVDYFKALAKQSGVPYQSLINLYLRDCATRQKRLSLQWSMGGGNIRDSRASYRTKGHRVRSSIRHRKATV